MSEESRPGYYLDENGEWQKDRRKKKDRRQGTADPAAGNRRKFMRRKSDREFLDKEHRAMIEDALSDFAHEPDTESNEGS